MTREEAIKVAERLGACVSFQNKLRKMLKTKSPSKVYRSLELDDLEEIIETLFPTNKRLMKRLNSIDNHAQDKRSQKKQLLLKAEK